jgi:hypothetical protein
LFWEAKASKRGNICSSIETDDETKIGAMVTPKREKRYGIKH